MLWQERFNASSAWQHLEQARVHMNASTLPEDPSEQDALDYAGWVLVHIETRREDSDAHEITPSMLSNLASATASFATYIENVNTGSYTWATVVPQADAVMDSLASWPPLKISRYMSGINSALESFQTKASGAVEDVREKSQTLTSELQAVAERQNDVKALVESERQRISEAVAQFTTTSAEAVTLLREDQEERLAALAQRWESNEEAANARADATVNRLGVLEEQAKNVVHAATSRIVATDYGKYARNKTIAAWICDITAALIGGAGVVFIGIHLLSIEPEADANIGLSLTRIAVSLGTLGIAGLLGHRGQQHHLEARAAKRTDLALRQVLPFTANLEEAEQRRIVREFTDRVFIKGDIDIAKTSRPLPPLRRTRQMPGEPDDSAP